MIRKILFPVLLVAVFACKSPETQNSGDLVTVKLSGQFKGEASEESFSLAGSSSIEEIPLDKENKFSKTFRLKKGLYYLSFVPLYLDEGFDMNLAFNLKNREKPYVITGKGAKENETLEKINREVWDFQEKTIDLLTEPFTVFWDKLKAFPQSLESQLSDTVLNQEFVKIEKQDIKYIAKNIAGMYLNGYGMKYGKKTGEVKKTGKTLSEEEKSRLKQFIDRDVDLNDEKLFAASMSYREFLSRRYWSDIKEEGKENTPANRVQSAFAAIDKTFQNDEIKEYFRFKEFDDYLMFGSDNFLKDNYAAYKKSAKNPQFIQSISESYQKIMRSAAGETAPDFSYEAIDGKKMSLSSLKGNYVYIDIWATWCGPCIVEQPAFEKMREQYKNKPVRFVSLSVDQQKDKEKWKKHIVSHQLKGLHLITDKSFNSDFIQFFQVKGIPRFILLDPQGRIVNPNAPRPSESVELKKLFSSSGL